MPSHPGPSSQALSSRMSRLARRETVPELALRRELHGRGLRYRVVQPVPGRPRRSIDIAFPGVKVAVMVDGCFWHGCAEHGTQPGKNSEWWRQKIATNQARDADTTHALEAAGWTVVRIWEHEPPSAAADLIETLVRSRSRRLPRSYPPEETA